MSVSFVVVLRPSSSFTDCIVNFCIVEPSGVRTNFEGSSKRYTDPHAAYSGRDMPARKLEAIVERALGAGAGIEPVAVAEALFKVASRGDKVPLHLALGHVSIKLIRSKLESRLQTLDMYMDLSAIGS